MGVYPDTCGHFLFGIGAWDPLDSARKMMPTALIFSPRGRLGANFKMSPSEKCLVDVLSLEFTFRKPPNSCFQGRQLFAKVPATDYIIGTSYLWLISVRKVY